MLKQFIISTVVVLAAMCGADAAFTSCGPGYVLVESRKTMVSHRQNVRSCGVVIWKQAK